MYPSRQASTPRYSVPEFSFTFTGRPRIDFRKSDGDFDFDFFPAAADGAPAGAAGAAVDDASVAAAIGSCHGDQ